MGFLKYKFSPIIMEVENGCISNISFLSFGVVFHFHDYGRKGNKTISIDLFVALLRRVTE